MFTLAMLCLLSATPPAAAQALAAGEAHRVRVEPGRTLWFQLEPAAGLVTVTVTFDGAEVAAALFDGSGRDRLNAARMPERSRGEMTLSAVLGEDASASPAAAPSAALSGGGLRLSLEVVRDYERPADVVVRWTRGEAGVAARDRELIARQHDICASVEDWRDGSVERLRRAATRLTTGLTHLRQLDAPALVFESLVTLGQIHLDLSERDPALAALTEAGDLARARGDGNAEGLALLKLAVVRGTTGDPKAAVSLYEQALALRRRAGDLRGEVDTLYNQAATQIQSGAQAAALAALDRAAPLAEQLGDRRVQSLFENLRGVTLAQTGKPREAIDAYTRALAWRRLVGDRLGEGQTLSNMGTVLRDLGEVRRGLALLEEALAIRRATGHKQGVANTLYNLGNANLDLGRYQRAIDAMTESLALWRETQGVRGEAFTLQNLGLAAARLGDQERARTYYEQALPLWTRVGDRRGEAIVLNHLAGHALRTGDLDGASSYIDRALAAARAAKAPREEAEAVGLSGQVLRQRGDRAAALARLREALAAQEVINNRHGAAATHVEIGVTLEADGQLAPARDAMRAALTLREEMADPRGQVVALAGLARIDRRMGALADAQASALRALDLVEQLRGGVMSTRSRTIMGVSAQTVYELAREVSIDRHLIEPQAGHDRAALAIYERARARSLLEGLSAGRPRVPEGDPAVTALATRQEELESDIEAKTARLGRLSDAGQPAERLAEARAELSTLVLALDDVRAEIRRKSPAYAALTQPRTVSAGEMQALPGPDAVLIEIALGDTRSVGWLVSADGVRTIILPARAAIEEAARGLVAALAARNLFPDGETRAGRTARIARADRQWPVDAARLTALVFAPFGPFTASRVAIVADGALAGVPFAVLPMTRADGRLHPERPCPASTCGLGGHADVIALPSASVLAELRRSRAARPAAPLRAAVLADPVFRADDPRVTRAVLPASTGNGAAASTAAGPSAPDGPRTALLQSIESLPRLPFSREEAKAIQTLAGAAHVAVALDFDASRETLARDALGADVLHIATHALVDETQPELSGIVLSLVDPDGRRVRGFVPLVEIYDLPVRADLVVLSACRTAAGLDVPGEGLASLTRGFMYAGSRRVIASLWSVEDRATAAFMRAFYQALLVGRLPAAAALRAAQAELRRTPRWSTPYHWAAFTFHGDWQ